MYHSEALCVTAFSRFVRFTWYTPGLNTVYPHPLQFPNVIPPLDVQFRVARYSSGVQHSITQKLAPTWTTSQDDKYADCLRLFTFLVQSIRACFQTPNPKLQNLISAHPYKPVSEPRGSLGLFPKPKLNRLCPRFSNGSVDGEARQMFPGSSLGFSV